MRVGTVVFPSCVIACAAVLAACSGGAEDEPIGVAASALGAAAHHGKHLFDDALPGTNGRACATCHVPDKHFALHPEDVAARLASDPNDPLFNPLDADDPTADTPTYDHLMAGFVRVTLTLADNLDVVDASGNVITSCARTIDVWRGVPTVENTAYTAPFQYDGRFATLQQQANGALDAHSQIDHPPTTGQLDDIAAYEKTVFSDHAAFEIAEAFEAGGAIPHVDPHLPAGSLRGRGQALFYQACSACHGTATQTVTVREDVHDQLFPVLDPDGTVEVSLAPPPQQKIYLANTVHHDLPDHHQLNIGIAFGTYLAESGGAPVPPHLAGLDFPRYRIRFYTDATRTEVLYDLPPLPSDGAASPAIGPTLAPQLWTVDPGRAATSGDPADWEAFDVPQLRGVKHTAPYFHDNSAFDLRDVLDVYSRFVLPQVPELHFYRDLPPEGPGLPPESLSVDQKLAIIAYLETL